MEKGLLDGTTGRQEEQRTWDRERKKVKGETFKVKGKKERNRERKRDGERWEKDKTEELLGINVETVRAGGTGVVYDLSLKVRRLRGNHRGTCLHRRVR